MSTLNAERLIRLRKKLGLSQREVAKEFRVSPGAIGFWESGGRIIPGPILKLIETFEHHLNPVARRASDQQLGKICSAWTDKLLSAIPARRTRTDTSSLRSTMKQLFQRHLSNHLSHDPIKRSVQIATYSKLVDQFDKTKGLPLKIIQLASYLDPDMPRELRDCLNQIQGAITGMPSGTAARIIFEEFGKSPSELFSEWSANPIAAASLGQVHRARLHSGEWVAVKVQYPEVREDLESAFKNPVIQDLLFTLIKTGGNEILDEFKSRVLDECDYREEARSQEKFFEFFKNDPEIKIPRIFARFCSDRVITSEFIDGQSFREFIESSSQVKRNWAAETMVRFQGESFFWHNTLYADIHPGNLLFVPGKMVFIDFGRVLRCEDSKFHLLGELMQNVLANDAERGEKTIEALGMIADWTGFDFKEFWNLLREQHCHFWDETPFEFNDAYLSRKNQLMRSFRQKQAIHLNGPSFWNFFAVSTHDAIRAELTAKANWRGLILKTIHAKSNFN